MNEVLKESMLGIKSQITLSQQTWASCSLHPAPGFTQPSILSGSVNEYRLRLGRYKAGMCDAAWCAPCTWAPLQWAMPTKGCYSKCSTLPFLSHREWTDNYGRCSMQKVVAFHAYLWYVRWSTGEDSSARISGWHTTNLRESEQTISRTGLTWHCERLFGCYKIKHHGARLYYPSFIRRPRSLCSLLEFCGKS